MLFRSDDAYKKVNVVVQYKFSTVDNLKKQREDYSDSYASHFTDAYNQYFGSKTVRWAVDPTKTLEEQMKSPATLYGEDNADCTCPDSLTNFINWAAKTYPAKKYILVMNDHGHGYRPDEDLPDVTDIRGMIFDDGYLLSDGSKKHFTVKNFTRAIRSANVRFETIYLLACLMNNLEYLYEMRNLCDYIIAATYTMPATGGALGDLVEQFAKPSVDVEKALSAYCEADVKSWDEAWEITENNPIYTDLTVSRTAAFDALGPVMKEFTDRLCNTYQNGTEEQKQKIDECTEEAVKMHMDNPYYDCAKYMTNIMLKLPEVYDNNFCERLEDTFNNTIVSQHRSKYLEAHDYQVDYSIILGVEGTYSVLKWKEDENGNMILQKRTRYCADGQTYVSNYTFQGDDNYQETQAQLSTPWGSTLAYTFEQLEFDRAVGWSRWIKLNRKEPSLFCPEGLNFVLPDGDASINPSL